MATLTPRTLPKSSVSGNLGPEIPRAPYMGPGTAGESVQGNSDTHDATRAAEASMSSTHKLTARQRLFVAEYMSARNATQAAIRAGYSAATARQIASENLSKPAIAAAIAALEVRQISEIRARFELSRAMVLRQIAIGAFNDPRGFYDEAGELIPIHKLSREQAALIEGVETTPVFEGSGQERRFVGHKVTYKLAKRAPFVDMAMRHLGEYKKDNEQGAKALVGSLAELVAGAKGSTLPIGGASGKSATPTVERLD